MIKMDRKEMFERAAGTLGHLPIYDIPVLIAGNDYLALNAHAFKMIPNNWNYCMAMLLDSEEIEGREPDGPKCLALAIQRRQHCWPRSHGRGSCRSLKFSGFESGSLGRSISSQKIMTDFPFVRGFMEKMKKKYGGFVSPAYKDTDQSGDPILYVVLDGDENLLSELEEY